MTTKLSSRTLISEVMFVSPLMIVSKAALESEKIANPSVVPESSRWVEYRMSASLIARSSLGNDAKRTALNVRHWCL
ncbi:hypothetical protein TNCV_1896781 [Trichonephila clavipes]|nr:hypothetical protein TNCV_1896781 [Trichonephila clavipes]